MTRLVVVLDAVRAALSSNESPSVYGIRRPAEDVVQALRSTPTATDELVGVVRRSAAADGDIRFPVGGTWVSFTPAIPIVGDCHVQLFEWRDGLDARRGGVDPVGVFAGKSVVVVGAGGLGAAVALLLAQAGVPRFDIIDPDTLDANNGSRHPCDIQDLGRRKVDAVADLLRRRGAECVPMAVDVCTFTDFELENLIRGTSLVIIATDSPQAQFHVNEVCVGADTPAVVPAAYERACAGEVLLVRPGTGPCLYCATGFRAGVAPAVTVRERRQAYQAADANRLVAEPGLAADIASIAAVATAYALAVLDPMGSRAPLLDPAKAFVLVHGGSVPRDAYADLFQAPFDLIYARVTRDDPCPVCGYQNKGE